MKCSKWPRAMQTSYFNKYHWLLEMLQYRRLFHTWPLHSETKKIESYEEMSLHTSNGTLICFTHENMVLNEHASNVGCSPQNNVLNTIIVRLIGKTYFLNHIHYSNIYLLCLFKSRLFNFHKLNINIKRQNINCLVAQYQHNFE